MYKCKQKLQNTKLVTSYNEDYKIEFDIFSYNKLNLIIQVIIVD